MPKTREPEGGEDAKVDMTPMIDVTFLLIIFFVTIQQLTVQETAAQVVLPKAKQANPETADEKDRLIVSIDADGTYYVGPTRMDMARVDQALKREAALRDADGFAKRIIFVRADVAAPYGKVQDVMAQCRRHKIIRLAFRVREWAKR